MGNVGNLRRLLAACAAATVTLTIVAVSGAAPGTDASVTTFDQCANGKPPSTDTGCSEKWINGILNEQNSHYAEDEVTPQRVILDLPKGGPVTGRTIGISYLTRKSGVHAYDSLATWNHTQTSADRCADLNASDCVPGPETTFAIPLDGTTVADNNGDGSPTSLHQLAGQVFTMYGGTITGAGVPGSEYTHDDPDGNSDSYAHITLTYSVPSLDDDAKVMLLFGGHLGASLGPRGWGVGVGAGSISGGPYHIRITEADGGSVGSRDNQIMSGAILAPASLVIEKIAVGGDDTFNYAATGGIANPFSITTTGSFGSQSFPDISAGSYTVAESTLPAGWDFTDLQCVDEDDGTTVDLGTRTANIDLDPGETVTCTYVNTKRGKIVVEKQTQPDGDTQLFSFTPSYGAGFQLADGGSNESAFLAPGNYSVSETVPSGWSLMSATCDDGSSPGSIDLAAGETVRCTFTNAKLAKIIVDKVTAPANDPQSFSFSLTGGPDSVNQSFGLTHAATPHDSGLVKPGSYAVAETVPAGWSLTSAVCSDGSAANAVALDAGETVTCTFTNTKQSRIIVQKQTNPDGDTQVFGFTASYDANGFSLTDGQQDDSGPLAPGTYSVSETAPAGWDQKSAVCSDQSPASAIALAAGETVTCVFTNEKDANIVVEKQTNPNGDTQVFQFNSSYDANGFSLSDGQQNDSGDLDPGTYSVSETVAQGWDLVSAECDDDSNPSSISLAAGETVTCVFTNVKDAKIVVQKQTLPNADPQVFHFDASYDEGGFSLADGQSNDSGDLDPGTYSVSEDVPAGWALTSAVCSDESSASAIALSAGETVTCVFTNTKRGSIIVEKQTIPDGAAGTFAFSGDAAGSIGDNGQIVVSNLLPGTYTSTEAAAEGWNLTSIVCNDANSTGSLGTRTATFSVQAGETVKCTFSNVKPPPAGQGAIDVQKSANPTTVKEPGGPVTFSVTVTNISTVNVALENVVDNVYGDLDDQGGNGCFDVPVNLAPGERVNCTFQRTVTGAGGTAHVNVVKAEGHDEAGNEVSDTDDARVDITPRLIDLVIVKEATSPTPLNGIVNYTMTVTNKGPDDATNVQVADPAPAGILYLSADPARGTCSVTQSLITCSLGTLKAGETVTIRVTARATTVGTHTNTATVTGGGGRETNPADNVDSAITVVPAPAKPPVAKPAPKPTREPELCLTLTVSPKMITADGRPDRVTVKVTAGKKRMKGMKVSIAGAGVKKTGRSNAKGVAVLRVNPRKPGLITVTVVETNQRLCGPKRIGVVGVFLPPLTG